MALSKLTMKLSKHRCLECSTCAMFLSSLFKIEMFQAAIPGVVEKNHDKHDFCL